MGWARFQDRIAATTAHHCIPDDTVSHAFSIVCYSVIVIMAFAILLVTVEKGRAF
jgi:hypothetical protein